MEWESIVNQHSNVKKVTEHNTRRKNFLRKVLVSTGVAVAFIAASALKLVHPVLGEVGMMISFMIAFYNLGQAKECKGNA